MQTYCEHHGAYEQRNLNRRCCIAPGFDRTGCFRGGDCELEGKYDG